MGHMTRKLENIFGRRARRAILIGLNRRQYRLFKNSWGVLTWCPRLILGVSLKWSMEELQFNTFFHWLNMLLLLLHCRLKFNLGKTSKWVAQIFILFTGDQRVSGLQSGNLWHSDSYVARPSCRLWAISWREHSQPDDTPSRCERRLKGRQNTPWLGKICLLGRFKRKLYIMRGNITHQLYW